MGSYNKAEILGRLGSDIELNQTKSGIAVANISLATDTYVKDGENTTEWHKIVLWDKNAINAKEYVKKGNQLFVEGHLQTREYVKDDTTFKTTEIVANRVVFLDGKGGNLSGLGVGQGLSAAQNDETPF